MAELVPIREEDKQKSYYKYYKNGILPNTPEDFAFVENCKFPTEEGLPFARRTEIMQKKRVPAKSGYCELAEGGYMMMSTIPMPNTTGEMLSWWMAWHTLDGLRYSCWNPEDHYDVWLTEEDLARVLDPNVPVPEKTWGITVHAREMVADTMNEDATMRFIDPSTVGFDVSRIGTEECPYMTVSRSLLMGIPCLMAGTIGPSPEDGKMEFREYFWYGYDIVDGEVVCTLPVGENPGIEMMCKGGILHTRKEYRHLETFLSKIYAEEKDNW